jgi:hypothetical protein
MLGTTLTYSSRATVDLGILGNSHMLMMDKNHLQVADVILGWIDEQVEARKAD